MWWKRRNDQSHYKQMQHGCIERVYDKIRLCWQGDPPGIVQDIEIWPYEQMVYAQPKICPNEWN